MMTDDGSNRLDNPPDLSDFHLADIRELPPCADPSTEDDSAAEPVAPD